FTSFQPLNDVCAAIAHQPSNTACFQLSLFLMAQGREPATNTQVFQILPSVIGVRDNWYLLWDFDWLSDYFNCFYRHDSSPELFQYLIVKANSARRAIPLSIVKSPSHVWRQIILVMPKPVFASKSRFAFCSANARLVMRRTNSFEAIRL